MSVNPIDDHLARFGPEQRRALESVRSVVRATLPAADEVISYGLPTFKVDGVAVLGFDGFTRHNSLFPYSSQVAVTFERELAGYVRTKGSIHFDATTPFPAPLLRRILRSRITEINAGYPKKSGEFKEFYSNGQLKVVGRMRHGERHGSWTWFRRDGRIMRTGTFGATTTTGVARTVGASDPLSDES